MDKSNLESDEKFKKMLILVFRGNCAVLNTLCAVTDYSDILLLNFFRQPTHVPTESHFYLTDSI